MSDGPAPGIDGGNALSQKVVEATRCNIMSLDIRLNGMVAWTELTCSLTVWMKSSISGTCSFLDTQFWFIPRAFVSLCSGLNSQSVCICVILKPRCRYSLCTCVIPSPMFSNFQFLIILPVVNMTFPDMVLSKPIPLMFMRSHQTVTSLYLSRMVLGTLVIFMGSIYCILHLTVLPIRCGMLVP